MSANADVLQGSELIGSKERETALPQTGVVSEINGFDAENFALEQIRGLVRRVFFAGGGQAMKQVVFSAAEPHTDVGIICDQVGQALALETRADIAIVGRNPCGGETSPVKARYAERAPIKSWSTKIAVNLWRVPESGLRERSEESGTGRYWLSCLAELRNEFEYAVIHGPAAGISSEAAFLGQMADGIILVLRAQSTRGAAARKIKEALEGAQSRILGAVLSERMFPVPERIYRRL
jgi:hypothetical protein